MQNDSAIQAILGYSWLDDRMQRIGLLGQDKSTLKDGNQL